MADELSKYEELPDKAVDAGDIKEYEKSEPPPSPSVIMLPGQTINKTYQRKTINIKQPKEPRAPKIITALPGILPKQRKTNELDDLFEVQKDEDIYIDDLVEMPTDLLMNDEPKRKPKTKKYTRTTKSFNYPVVGGLQ